MDNPGIAKAPTAKKNKTFFGSNEFFYSNQFLYMTKTFVLHGQTWGSQWKNSKYFFIVINFYNNNFFMIPKIVYFMDKP